MKLTKARGAMTRRGLMTAIAAVAVAGTLAACSGTGGGSATTAPAGGDALDAALAAGGSITYWSWTPQATDQVAAFEKQYPNVTVNLVNAGTGGDEYTKLQNAIAAGSGAPDVVQIEYYALPQFALSGGLLDLTQYGFGDLQSKYTAGTWGHVSIGGAIYGLPQDSGPIALFYNKKVFDQYGLTVPTTWDQYIDDAKKLHAANPKDYITSDTGDAGFTTTMIWQAGGQPFQTNGTKVTINLQDAGSAKWATMWDQLLSQGLLAPTPGWTDDWYKGLGDGSIASLIIGAWMPGVLEGSVKQASGDWAVAPVPSYDGNPAGAENGGGAQSVTKQSQNPALAAAFLRWLNSDDASLSIFTKEGGFPSTVAQLNDPAFLSYSDPYFGGQQINQVLSQAASAPSSPWQYLPYQVYANSIFGDTVGQAYTNKSDLNAALQAWQQKLVDYGNQQGFQVNQ